MAEMTWEALTAANSLIKTTDIKGKNYAEVPQRIKAFRYVFPMGSIVTELLSIEDGSCIFKATVLDETGRVLGTGTAFENKDSSFINKTSYIENCETSAVGRALGMCGFGIDTSIASAEEVLNAINNQNKDSKKDSEKEPKNSEHADGYVCVECGVKISPIRANGKVYTAEELASKSLQTYGQVLCSECAKHKKWVMENENNEG